MYVALRPLRCIRYLLDQRMTIWTESILFTKKEARRGTMKSFKLIVSVAGIAALIVGSLSAPSQTGQELTSSPTPVTSTKAPASASKAVSGVSSVSLAYSYETFEELEAASVLIAEISIKDVRLTDEENDATFYNATVTDLLKVPADQTDIVLMQVGVEEE